ncbi:hypothetical protein M5X11_28065 [Paenibacillus alginolyticus]|uniref:hypothetical protein n=1 Tax=Paenibacillus alginolyticus TaxID=59839 RepID=UPI0004004D2F|nr:hypothetical protein [Paenibacillus alginolyticus]MCY9668734.1 hypothetical protein [Paenibacillus alginolyticus]
MDVIVAEVCPHFRTGRERLRVVITGTEEELDSQASKLLAIRTAYEKGWYGHGWSKSGTPVVNGRFCSKDFIFHSRL